MYNIYTVQIHIQNEELIAWNNEKTAYRNRYHLPLLRLINERNRRECRVMRPWNNAKHKEKNPAVERARMGE